MSSLVEEHYLSDEKQVISFFWLMLGMGQKQLPTEHMPFV